MVLSRLNTALSSTILLTIVSSALLSLSIVLTMLLAVLTAPLAMAQIELSAQCPPGFDKNEQDRCILYTLYDQYDSIENAGVGGLTSSLPPRRDGFRAQQIDLGRYLFFDPILSGSGTLSCASCHHPSLGFSDGRGRSVGAGGEQLSRSAPTLWNSAFLNSFFWDARAKTLELQLLGPLYDPREMANTPVQLLTSLNTNVHYQTLFADAFPQGDALASGGAITLAQIYQAISAFESSLISLNSRYDRYAHGFHQALNEREIKGLNIFRSFVARCAECHQPPLFTNQQIAVIGTPEPTGLPLDVGAQNTYGSPRLKGAFKIPTLRNIAKTAPYMHSGRFATLRDAVEFYTKGRGHAVPAGVELELHWHINEPNLSDLQLDLLVEFLKTLGDEQFTPAIPGAVPSGLIPVGTLPELITGIAL
ncbi:MAG: cytochrome c peroxidase [Paraglaciecola psychrophila]|jgi:cytochrome c peroxidase